MRGRSGKVTAAVQTPVERYLLYAEDVERHRIGVGRLEHVDFAQRLLEVLVLDAYVSGAGRGRALMKGRAFGARLEHLDLVVLVVARRLAEARYDLDDVEVLENVLVDDVVVVVVVVVVAVVSAVVFVIIMIRLLAASSSAQTGVQVLLLDVLRRLKVERTTVRRRRRRRSCRRCLAGCG